MEMKKQTNEWSNEQTKKKSVEQKTRESKQ